MTSALFKNMLLLYDTDLLIYTRFTIVWKCFPINECKYLYIYKCQLNNNDIFESPCHTWFSFRTFTAILIKNIIIITIKYTDKNI